MNLLSYSSRCFSLLKLPALQTCDLLLESFLAKPRQRSMSSSSIGDPDTLVNEGDLRSFHNALKKSSRVLALLGAGLSAPSGLPTFRGAGGLWRTHDSVSLATPEAFNRNPGLVWQFYSYRRHMALQASPNAAHYALAELARRMPGFMTLSQNVDGLSQRAQHPMRQLQLLHGTLFEVRCVDPVRCGYSRTDFTDPIVPALAIPTSGVDPTTIEARKGYDDQLQPQTRGEHLDISDVNVHIPTLGPEDLPTCPNCHRLLRPGVVWFGESLPNAVLDAVDKFIDQPERIDIMMVIGTSAKVFPAANYAIEARKKGARVCVVNMDESDRPPGGWEEGDWFFKGDAAVIVPKLLEPIVGQVQAFEDGNT